MIRLFADLFRIRLLAATLAILNGMLYCANVAAQAPFAHKFTHLDINNGLASNHVSAILQDRKGFIWIASTALQRYDGSNLITVASFDRIPGSIYYDDICLCEDKKGRIWMGTPDNIRIYDPVTTRMRVVKTLNSGATSEGLQCSNILEDQQGDIWASTDDGLLKYDTSTQSFRKAIRIPEVYRSQIQDAIMEDEKGNIWFSGEDGLFILSKDRKQLYHHGNNPEHLPVLNIRRSFKRFYTDPAHNIWLAARGGYAYRYDPATMRLDSFYFTNKGQENRVPIFDISAGPEGRVWVATETNGIFRFNPQAQKFDLNIQADNADPQALHYDYEANCMMSDREGHLWIGTDHGVNILSLHSQSFHVLDQRTKFSQSKARLPSAEVTGIFQGSNGYVYIGYWGKGFACLSPNMDLLGTFNNKSGPPDSSIPEERSLVWTFAELHDGTIVIGQENGNLSLFDPITRKFKKHLQHPALHLQTPLVLLPQYDTTVWIGLYKKGLACWNPATNRFSQYQALLDSLQRPTSVMDIVPYQDSLLWLATSTSGLLLFNPHNNQLTERYTFKWKNRKTGNVTCLLRYNDSLLLAGTDQGLWIFNLHTRKSHPILNHNQLFNEWVLGMEKDKTKDIWLTTQYGFYKLSMDNQLLETFVQGDDIIDNNRKVRRQVLQLQNGQLLIGASDYVLSLDPHDLKKAPPPPDVTILNLRVMDSMVLIGAAMAENKPVELHHRQNFISIEFKSLQYHQEKIKYYYQLEGVDEKWVIADASLIAKYTNLPPGNYTFRVKSANSTGTYSDDITMLKINIRPAFWQTGWFRLLALALAVALIYFYVRLRISIVRRDARQRASIQQEIAQLEMKALRAQMNPHFIFNALNSIQIFMMKNETESAQAYLSRFAKLIRNVLDNSQLNHISVVKEVSMLENYMELEKLRFTDQFEYSIIVDPQLEADLVEIPTMIVQPFVENAIWHGLVHKKEKGRLTIRFWEEPGRILCTVEDNGVGREKSAAIKQMQGERHRSRGLQITRDRLVIYNSRFHVEAGFEIEDLYQEDGSPAGTRVTLWFPQELDK
ncbi:ligand-binding sensor domain-containing protein [Chitinophaga dinghuensis]|nr:two-component regulator propeller domain-containing protein [Chitinophaga dinghuensis]